MKLIESLTVTIKQRTNLYLCKDCAGRHCKGVKPVEQKPWGWNEECYVTKRLYCCGEVHMVIAINEKIQTTETRVDGWKCLKMATERYQLEKGEGDFEVIR